MATGFKTIIGRAEVIDLLIDDGALAIPAKIDTGAYSSSVWATDIVEKGGVLEFTLLGPEHLQYTGERLSAKKFKVVTVQNSFGKSEKRYGLDMSVRFCGKRVTTFFTLADRSKKLYPVLVGRKLLKGRFVVDVSGGHPIADEMTEETLGFSGLKNRVHKRS